MTRSGAVWSLLLIALLAGGCAPRSITLQPGKAEWGEARPATAGEWSLWVAEVVDRRPGAAEGAKVGLLYPRFQSEPQTVYLDPPPTRYLHRELSRFLLHRGLEASAAGRAKVHLRAELEEFSLTEEPGSVVDEITVRVAYTVRFANPRGDELGNLRLQGSSVIQTPVSAGRKAAEGFRDAVADTFPALVDSEVFGRVMAQLQQPGR